MSISPRISIRYRATEKSPRSCDLVIRSDDSTEPVKMLQVIAQTVWPECSCARGCEDCRKGCCEKHHRECCCRSCADDCGDDNEHEDALGGH
jgi:hypothetical protein